MIKTVIITGAGFRTKKAVQSITNIFTDKSVKINIGCAVARRMVEENFDLILISRNQEKLDKIKNDILDLYPSVRITTTVLNILEDKEVKDFAKKLNPKSTTYHYVHSSGLSSGSYKVKNDNPYLTVTNTSEDLVMLEFEIIVKSLLLMMKHLLPVFEKQKETRVVVINSMSGIRPFPFGFSHSAAKGGLHNAVRSLCLELNNKNIRVSEVNPGIVDTGFYDNKEIQKAIINICKTFGYNIKEIPKMPPSAVAAAVKLCLTEESHFLSINMVAPGQIPNLGA